MGATPEPCTGDAMECRWCGKQITKDLHGWVDNTGFYNCQRLDQPRHAPIPGLATYRDELRAAVDWMDNPDGEPSSSALVARWRALLSDTPDTGPEAPK